jgi:hypothetical protein
MTECEQSREIISIARRGARSTQPLLQPWPNSEQGAALRLIIYIIGFMILIGGLAWGAITAGVPQLYVQIGAVILLGIGIIMGVSTTRYRSGGDVTVVKDNDTL